MKHLSFPEINRLMHGGRSMITAQELRARSGGGSGDQAPKAIEIPELAPETDETRLREPSALTVTEPEDALKAIHDLRDVATRLAKKGRLDGAAMEKLTGGMRTVAERLEAQETEISKLRKRQILPVGGDGTVDLRSIALRLKAPRRVDPLYFNLIACDPDELSYAGMLDRSLASMTPQLRSWASRRGLSEASKSLIYEAQALNDFLIITDALLAHADPDNYGASSRVSRMRKLKLWRDWKTVTEGLRDAAMDGATAGEGTEWIPTILSAQLQTLIGAELSLASFFQWPTMPGKTWENPVEGADAIAYLIAEALDDPAASAAKPPGSVPGTKKMTLTAKKFGARVILSNESIEDAIIDLVPHVLARIARAIARGREKAMIDGQSSGAIDTADAPGSSDVRSAWDGFRKQQKSIGSSLEVDLSTLSAEAMAQLKGVLKEYGQMPDEGLWATGYSGFIRLLTLYDKTGGSPIVLTQDKMGAGMTFARGQLGIAFGSPVVVSQFIREDLNASGIYDNITTTKTILLYVNRRAWLGGERRAVTIRTLSELKAESDQTVALGTWRGDFKPVNFPGTQRFVALGKNIASF